MEKDYGKDIEQLQSDMQELKALIAALAPQKPVAFIPNGQASQKVRYIPPAQADDVHCEILKNLGDLTNAEENSTGALTYLGVFARGGNQYTWIQSEIKTNDLLQMIEDHRAEHMLQCVSSQEKLTILLHLLREPPMSVAQLVEHGGFNSTGQVYHHLNALVAAGIVYDAGRGAYAVQPHRVQGIMMILAGIADLL